MMIIIVGIFSSFVCFFLFSISYMFRYVSP